MSGISSTFQVSFTDICSVSTASFVLGDIKIMKRAFDVAMILVTFVLIRTRSSCTESVFQQHRQQVPTSDLMLALYGARIMVANSRHPPKSWRTWHPHSHLLASQIYIQYCNTATRAEPPPRLVRLVGYVDSRGNSRSSLPSFVNQDRCRHK